MFLPADAGFIVTNRLTSARGYPVINKQKAPAGEHRPVTDYYQDAPCGCE